MKRLDVGSAQGEKSLYDRVKKRKEERFWSVVNNLHLCSPLLPVKIYGGQMYPLFFSALVSHSRKLSFHSVCGENTDDESIMNRDNSVLPCVAPWVYSNCCSIVMEPAAHASGEGDILKDPNFIIISCWGYPCVCLLGVCLCRIRPASERLGGSVKTENRSSTMNQPQLGFWTSTVCFEHWKQSLWLNPKLFSQFSLPLFTGSHFMS